MVVGLSLDCMEEWVSNRLHAVIERVPESDSAGARLLISLLRLASFVKERSDLVARPEESDLDKHRAI